MKTSRYLLALLLLTSAGNIGAQTWPKALPEARPAARWWWLGSAVDSANLAYNMAEYAKAGMGGLEITPIYGVQGNEQHDIAFLSPRWMNMLAYTQALGKKVGLEVDMNTGTGWPFGNPKVAVTDAACKVLFQEYTLQGGKRLNVDVAVQDARQKPYARLQRLMAFLLRDGNVVPAEERTAAQCIDLTAWVDTTGMLRWKAPAGSWRLIALYAGRTLQKVKRAAPGGEGYVIDHFDSAAVSRYLHIFDEAFARSGTPYPHTFFNDSYEVYGADWSPTLLREFASRRGYRLERFLPEFLAQDGSDISRRIVSDYRETLSDMLLQNFTRQWTAWAHSHGSITRNQAHGSPANLLDLYGAVDIPEIEGFGLSQLGIKGLRSDPLTHKNFSDISMLKYASSGAHITGRQFTSSETFTWLTDHFRASLSQCKPDLDLMFVGGVNHIFFHGTPYSPRETRWPGWQFYASIDMSPTNSIWHDAPYFFEYVTRCQSMLQAGSPDNDFLVYLPVYDMWYEQPGRLLQFDIHTMDKKAPRFIGTIHNIMRNGFDVDYISDRHLLSTTFGGGRLQTEGGSSYKALIVPAANRMPEAVMQHLLALAREGAPIIFLDKMPSDVPGFDHYAEGRRLVQDMAQQLAALPNVEVATAWPDSFTLAVARPEPMRTEMGLSVLRRTGKQGTCYFIASLQPRDVDGWVPLGVKTTNAHLLDPMTGATGTAALRQRGEGTEMYLQLRSGESIFLQTETAESDTAAAENLWPYWHTAADSLVLDRGWSLHFLTSEPRVDGTFHLPNLGSWTDIATPDSATAKALRATMATGLYSIDFSLTRAAQADDWMLDLGDVRESARVRINGHDAGCLWAVPYTLRVGQFLHRGRNHLEVEVTNLAANRIAQMDRDGQPWRIFKEINVVDIDYHTTGYGSWAPMPSGLCSTPVLRALRHIDVTGQETNRRKSNLGKIPYNDEIQTTGHRR